MTLKTNALIKDLLFWHVINLSLYYISSHIVCVFFRKHLGSLYCLNKFIYLNSWSQAIFYPSSSSDYFVKWFCALQKIKSSKIQDAATNIIISFSYKFKEWYYAGQIQVSGVFKNLCRCWIFSSFSLFLFLPKDGHAFLQKEHKNIITALTSIRCVLQIQLPLFL